MIKLKVYDKNYNPLTTFIGSELTNLAYSTKVSGIGSASFVLDLNDAKVTEENVRYMNMVEIYDDDGLKWAGIISSKQIQLNVISIKCLSLIARLKKRRVSAGYILSGDAGQAVNTLLTYINGIEDTGIDFGDEDIAININKTFDRDLSYSIIETIAKTANAQFEVDLNNKLNFKSQIGTDKSNLITFRYNINQIQLSNILSFNVSEDGEPVFTKAVGKSGAFTSTQQDAALIAKYGMLEQYKNYRVANTQGDLDYQTEAEIGEARVSPNINLSPNVSDNFNAGDIVHIQIINKLVNFEGDYQILEKNVKINGSQKEISVKINSLEDTIVDKYKVMEDRLSLLENKL